MHRENLNNLIKRVVAVVSLLLFLTPFFWFKNGVVDLGGDSSRVYFVDPVSYLKYFSLSGMLSIGHGIDYAGYYSAPFAAFLALLSYFFRADRLDALLTGINLAGGFLFVYLSVRTLQTIAGSRIHSLMLSIASMIAALLYVFLPFQTISWEKPLSTQYAFFLNPLFFYLILKFLQTSKFIYPIILLLVSFIFSQNFSFAGTPYFFSFYPLTLLYLYWVMRKKISKKIIGQALFTAILFLLIHSFHWMPFIQAIFDRENSLNTTVFNVENIKDRGLQYFLSSAENVFIHYSLIGAIQFWKLQPHYFTFYLYITAILGSGYIIWRYEDFRKYIRIYVITVIIFLLTLTLVSGHIFQFFKNIYASLFYIPGFSMFRAFNDKWGYTHYFYFALLFGFSLPIVLNHFKAKYQYLIVAVLFIPFASGYAFIRGDTVFAKLYGSDKLHSGIVLEDSFMESLNYLKRVDDSGKWLSLPLADWEYQLVRDKNNGIYVAPSILSLLRNKNDYVGLYQFDQFKEKLQGYLLGSEYDSLRELFSVLGIQYVYLNKDQIILDSYKNSYPYSEISTYFTQSVASYSGLLARIGSKRLAIFGDTYEILRLDDKAYPRVFAPDCVARTNTSKFVLPYELPLCDDAKFPAVIYSDRDELPADYLFRVYDPIDQYGLFSKNTMNENILYSFARFKPNTPIYPIIRIKENYDLRVLSKSGDVNKLLNKRFEFASKRIYELDRWRTDIPMAVSGSCTYPKIYCEYQKITWFGILDSYEQLINDNIKDIRLQYAEEPDVLYDNLNLVNSYITRDSDRVRDFIADLQSVGENKDILLIYANRVFDRLTIEIGVKNAIDDSRIEYKDLQTKAHETAYYLKTKGIGNGVVLGGPLDRNMMSNGSVRVKPSPNILGKPHIRSSTYQMVNSSVTMNHIGKENFVWIVDEGVFPDTYYVLDINFQTRMQPFELRVNEVANNPATGVNESKALLEKTLIGNESKIRSYIFKTRAKKGHFEIDIHPLDPSMDGSVTLNTISLRSLPLPDLLEVSPGTPLETPDVQFTQVNATKYRVHVANITSPFYLTLNNNFNSKWRLYEKNASAQKLNGFFRVVNSLYSFMDRDALEFMTNKRLDVPHVNINSFANGWLITPDDIKNKTSADFVIENSAQGMFYIASTIALITILCVSLLLVILTVLLFIR